jgi:putative oxidoreductase
MHDFWNLPAGELQTAHEMQNFSKNLAIMAGLLGLAGLGGGPWSLDARRQG